MHASTALAWFLPTDPGYTPFGLPWLRGLNVPQFALVGFVGLLWGLESVAIPDPGNDVSTAWGSYLLLKCPINNSFTSACKAMEAACMVVE